MFYRIDKENNIVDCAEFKYADDCLTTEKNIVRSFDGKLMFEEETLIDEYKLAEEKNKVQVDNNNKLNELTNWFKNDYTTYEQMLVRRKTLGIEDTIVDEVRNKTYHNIIELYEEAEVVAGEIRQLREK